MRIKDLLSEEKAAVPPKPRNFVAKNAKMGGAGQHKDKKKAEKQGDTKHKKDVATMEQGVAEGSDQHTVSRTWAQITDYEKRAKTTSNDIKKQHLMKMAADLRRSLPTSDEQGVAEAGYNHGYGDPRAPKLGGYQRDMDDEANVMYVYDTNDGRLKQKMISNPDRRSAEQSGFKDTPEQALKAHSIIKSKFDPKKYVQNQNGKWVTVYPYGQKTESVEEGLDYSKRQQLIRFLAKKLNWDTSHLELASDAELVTWYKNVQAGKKPMGY